MEILLENAHWIWIATGVLLIAAEAFIPGEVLIWFGLAGILTGVVEKMFSPSLDAQMLFFSVIAVGLTVTFKLWQRKFPPKTPASDSGTALNRPGAELVGTTLVLSEAIKNGRGRAKVSDTSWRCTGPDLPVGSKVDVLAVQSGTLVVEPAKDD